MINEHAILFCCRFDVRQLIMSSNGFVVCVGHVVADHHGRSDGHIRRTYIGSPSREIVFKVSTQNVSVMVYMHVLALHHLRLSVIISGTMPRW